MTAGAESHSPARRRRRVIWGTLTDDLTSLLLAARDGDRLALAAWISHSQAEV